VAVVVVGGVMGASAFAVVLGALMLVSSACGPVDWPMFGFDPGHSSSSTDTSIGPSDVPALMINDWTGSLGSMPLSPIVVGNRVFVTAGHELYAFDTSPNPCAWPPVLTCALWQGAIPGGYAPAYANGVVYVSTGDHRVYAFDGAGTVGCSAGTCLPLRTYDNGSAIVGPPVVVNGMLYVVTGAGLMAFDASGKTNCSGTPVSCTPLWTAPITDQGLGDQDLTEMGSAPAVADGKVYVDGNSVYVFDAAGTTNCAGVPKVCNPLWTSPQVTETRPSPVVANGVLFTGTTAYDATGTVNCSGVPKTCLPLFTLQASNLLISPPAVANGVVFLAAHDGNLDAFDATGHTGCGGTPAVCTPLWTASAAGGTPAVANGIVYVAGGIGQVLAFDAAGSNGCSGTPKTCSPIWSASTSGKAGLVPGPVVSHGYVYVPAVDGNLYGFRPDRTPPTTNIVTPQPGAVLKGTAPVYPNASDDGFVVNVEIRITGGTYNNSLLGDAYEAGGAWEFYWNTKTVTNGAYTLYSVAYDSVGHHTESAGVNITVAN
jgi:hypothetical protein